MSHKTIHFTSLPPKLFFDLESVDFTKAEKNHALKFIDNLMKRSWIEYGTIDGFVETPKNYFRKVFNSHYLSWLNKLINNNIISCNHSYSNIHTIYSKSYSINNIYSTPLMWLTFEQNGCTTVTYTYKKELLSGEEKKDYDEVIKDFGKLNIDIKDLLLVSDEIISNVKIRDFFVNEEIDQNTFRVWVSQTNKIWMSKDKAILRATSENKKVIQDGDTFYIISEEEFLAKKRTAMKISYETSILKLSKKNYYAKRNSTNRRMDSNFTNISKGISDRICKDNNLIQFDLCNSQFSILSHILEEVLDTEDFKSFKQHSYAGTLYDYIKVKLCLKDRKQAKTAMFELMFSKENLRSPLKNKLKELFPSVVDAVDDYKIKYGYQEFSIMLQSKESEIFIDGLWKEIKKKKIFCITKHDCLIVREQDEHQVVEIYTKYFNKIGFKGKILKE